jgi:hypothetical protein
MAPCMPGWNWFEEKKILAIEMLWGSRMVHWVWPEVMAMLPCPQRYGDSTWLCTEAPLVLM